MFYNEALSDKTAAEMNMCWNPELQLNKMKLGDWSLWNGLAPGVS